MSCRIPSSFLLLPLLLIISSSSVFFPAAGGGTNHGDGRGSFQPVKLQILDQYVVIGNGIVEVKLTNPGGQLTGVWYNGVDNLLEVVNGEHDRGYWDVVWKGEGIARKKGALDRMECEKLSIITEDEEQVELSFTRKWNSSIEGKHVPLDIDKRFIVRRGSSGFYTYAIYEHSNQHPAFELANTRLVIKLRKDIFHEMAISDKRQRAMPLPDDRLPPRGRTLAYPEAVSLVDPIEPEFKGEVDDKYEYSMENRDIKLHGWISKFPSVGFWQITPSSEFRSGGPLKQFLASHVGPTNLAVFHSTHYTGADMMIPFQANEIWKKVYGPVFIYINSLDQVTEQQIPLWDDAKNQLLNQSKQWPYQFLGSQDYPISNQRGTVTGRLSVREPLISNGDIPPIGAFVGLAALGEPGSWQFESKRYQFWTEVEKDGRFRINNVIAGQYNLYGFVPDFIGEYMYDALLEITPGRTIDVGDIVYEPPRNGSTLWEIGIPDRTAAEFFIPDANPHYINKLYLHQEKYRQYGLWERYAELYPKEDLVYNVHTDDYKKDWFFAQVTRKKDDNVTYQGTTWQVKFMLDTTYPEVDYTLRVALATANGAELQVRVNEPSTKLPLFTTGEIGKDNTIARHGIHGVYRLFNVTVPGSLLVEGNNTIFLTQAVSKGPFYGLMYDYIRFEGPLSPNPKDRN
ncbi:Rhamnogalacturonate lyase [Linum perenne]